jgi:hypothetical protein
MHKKFLLWCLLSIGYMPLPLLANTEETLGVAFVIEKQEIDLDFSGTTRETDFDSLQLHWYTGLMSHLDGSIVLGFIDTSQSSNPFPEGQNTSGNFLEFGLRAYYYRGEKFKLSSGFNYRYADTSNSQTSQDINWRWHQGTVDLLAQVQVANFLELQLGASAIFIDGEERASGTITQLIDFEGKDHLSGHAAAQIILDRTGRIGIKIDTGSLRGGQIYFARWF